MVPLQVFTALADASCRFSIQRLSKDRRNRGYPYKLPTQRPKKSVRVFNSIQTPIVDGRTLSSDRAAVARRPDQTSTALDRQVQAKHTNRAASVQLLS